MTTLVKIETRNFDSLKAVVLDGREIGFLTKGKNTRTDKHPWKMYLGKGHTSQLLGFTYVSESYAVNQIVDAFKAH